MFSAEFFFNSKRFDCQPHVRLVDNEGRELAPQTTVNRRIAFGFGNKARSSFSTGIVLTNREVMNGQEG